MTAPATHGSRVSVRRYLGERFRVGKYRTFSDSQAGGGTRIPVRYPKLRRPDGPLIERAVVVKEDNRGTIRASAAVPGSTLPDGVLLGGCLSRRVEEAISEVRVRLAGMG